MKASFTVPGNPKAKARPRFRQGGRPYTPRDTAQYEALVKAQYRLACGSLFFPAESPLAMEIWVYLPIPQSVSQKRRQAMEDGLIRPTKKPDWDNLGKIISDALNGTAYADDKQLVDVRVRKAYSHNPRAEVTVWEEKE